MTNGEKIKEIFPNSHIDERSHTVWVGYEAMSFRRDWWNAEYKELTTQERQAESGKSEAAFQDGYNHGYAQARFDYEQDSIIDKIRAEIEEYRSRQLTLAIGVKDLENGKQIAIEYVLAIIDKYKAESEGEEV